MSEYDGHLYALECQRINIETNAAIEHARPAVIWKPRVFPDGDMWCALYGDNLQDGVCGFGKSPDLATREFDRAWYEAAAIRTASAKEGGDA